MTDPDWAPGDLLDLPIPAHIEALREGGTDFLTRAFHAAGSLAPDNEVLRITRFEECPGGSTGRKLFLSVEYARPDPGLHTDLFAKFSRDFDNPIRDRGKDQMQSEVLLAALSRTPDFPISVLTCYYTDYDRESGSGILITERLAFGEDGIEPHYHKCMDHEVPDVLEHYQLLVRSVARLAGSERAGRLGPGIARQFPFDPERAAAADPIRYDARQMQNRIARFAEFGAQLPQLLPAAIYAPDFIAKLEREVPEFLEHERLIKRYLHQHPDFIALCHWNANIDNAWFWRDDAGERHCGLMDWGRVGQMNVALALWGCISACESDFLDAHLDTLLRLFVDEYHVSGGPLIDAEELKIHVALFVATMGLAWLMDGPALIRKMVPDLEEAESPRDPRFVANETARTQLHMVTNFLNLWRTLDFGAALGHVVSQSSAAPTGHKEKDAT